MKEVTFTPIVVNSNNWRVTLTYDGNGYSGRYDPSVDIDDEYHVSDQPVITLTVDKKIDKEWRQVQFGKQSTYLLATDPIELLEECADIILKKVKAYKDWSNNDYNRRFFMELGYIHLRKDRICLFEDLRYDSEDDS